MTQQGELGSDDKYKNKRETLMKTLGYFIFSFALALFLSITAQAGVLIDAVQVESMDIETTAKSGDRKGDYTISWQLNAPGRVTVLICDMKGNIVTTFMNKAEKKSGTHTVSWDGNDESGAACPGGLYFPVIRVKSTDRGVETYNPTAFSWGEEVVPDDLHYDSDGQVIRYTINQPTYVRIRVGEKDGGPLYKSIADWKLRSPGNHEEPWNGMDINNLINVAGKEKFQIAFDAFSVPENTIMLQSLAAESEKSETGKKYKQYPLHPPHGKQLAYFSLLPHGLLPDLSITAGFGDAIKKTRGVYQLRGQASIFIDLAKGTLGRNPEEAIELYLYVDGKMIHEGPAADLPAELTMDTQKFTNGPHMVTLNLRTSEDRAASFSTQVSIVN